MTVAYIVRCNFNDPSRESDWNAWYSGPKLVQMLSKPYFLTCQRFHKVAGEGRNYLAYWTLASPDALTTTEYTSDWGFFEWRPFIIDWSRDLFEIHGGGDVQAHGVETSEWLRFVSFDGMTEAAAGTEREKWASRDPGLVWHRSVGLDEHTPFFGVRVDKAATLTAIARPNEAIYRPISALTHTPRKEAA
jgi:hypothetical protein